MLCPRTRTHCLSHARAIHAGPEKHTIPDDGKDIVRVWGWKLGRPKRGHAGSFQNAHVMISCQFVTRVGRSQVTPETRMLHSPSSAQWCRRQIRRHCSTCSSFGSENLEPPRFSLLGWGPRDARGRTSDVPVLPTKASPTSPPCPGFLVWPFKPSSCPRRRGPCGARPRRLRPASGWP